MQDQLNIRSLEVEFGNDRFIMPALNASFGDPERQEFKSAFIPSPLSTASSLLCLFAFAGPSDSGVSSSNAISAVKVKVDISSEQSAPCAVKMLDKVFKILSACSPFPFTVNVVCLL